MLELLIYIGFLLTCMARYLTESELRRIKEFAATSKHEREPEMLLPDGD